MVTFDSLETAMSGDFQSLGWCCRDVRVQLNNTLNLVTYLQVQLLELMDENQQLKAQLEMCSEVKPPIKLKEAAHHFVPANMNEPMRMEGLVSVEDGNPSGDSDPLLPVPSDVPPIVGSTSQPSVNGGQLTHSPMNGEQPQRSEPHGDILISNVRSIPLKPKLSQPKVLDMRRDVKAPQSPLMEGNFKCDKCPMSFPTAEFLSFHMPTHAGKRKGYHICPVCDAMYVVKSDLSKHLAIHPDIKQYICPVCNKSYTSKNNYKLHVKIHTGEGLYPCSYCSKSFHTENHLNVHLRTHTGERPYECSYCQKSFTQKSGLVNHTRLHTGEKPFMCPLCPKAFTQKSNLNFHLSKHHPPFAPQNSYPSNDNSFSSESNKYPLSDSKFSPIETKFSPSDPKFSPNESKFSFHNDKFPPNDAKCPPNRFTSSEN